MQNFIKVKVGKIIVSFISIVLMASFAYPADSTIKIGVLAKRGYARCLTKWFPTAEYLTENISGNKFVIIPINYDQIYSVVEKSAVDFILANSSFYVELESWYGVSRVATLKNKRQNGVWTKFGGVVFCKKNRKDIRRFTDLKGKTFMAVKETSFGGWRMAWRELKQAGIDPLNDFESLGFGGTHDAVVYAVRDGKVDAGTVRTDTLERMQAEGKISLEDFNVVHEHGGGKVHLPFLHSTREYPEWPIAKMKHISNQVAEKVAVALINMPADSAAANAANCGGWTIPLNYQPVHECLKELKLGPYKDLGKIAASAVVKKYWIFLLAIAILFAAVLGPAIFILRLNRNIKKTQSILFQSEKRFKDLFNSITDLIYTQDMEGRFISVNSATAKTFGYEIDELIGKKGSDFMKTELVTAFENEYLEQIKTKGYHEGITAYFRKDGEKIYIEYRSSMVNPDDGEPYISGTGRDVTEKVLSERKVVKLQEQLAQAQKMESIGTMAGGIAHDFNNILFPMFGYLEMMLADIPEDSPLRGSLEDVFSGAKRARDLVQQILTFSRQKDHEPKPLKVHPVIKEALKLLKSSLPSTIEISQNIKTDCGLIMADSTRIHQIIMNLCTNAYHAMEETGGKLTVNLEEAELAAENLKGEMVTPGMYVCLTVSDTGTGMEQSVMDRMFDPYFTTKEKDKGTGLGLSVIHGIVKSHGGYITFNSGVGKGSEFRVYLPLIKRQPETGKVETDAPIQKGDERILLVDDQAAIIQMEKLMIERLGYHVTAWASSIDALETFRIQPDKFDLVITDMTMPNMTGEQLAVEIMKIRSDIPVIMCTGFSEMTSREKAESLGIKGFLMKPVVMKDLSRIIRKVLDE